MIRAVADKITRTRPTYTGRHRRERPSLTRVFRTPAPAAEAQSASGR